MDGFLLSMITGSNIGPDERGGNMKLTNPLAALVVATAILGASTAAAVAAPVGPNLTPDP
jgi:hypothetical protein